MVTRIGVLVGLLVAVSGCASAFTHIEKVDERRYFVTRTDMAVSVASGSLYECRAETETKMNCRKIATP